VRTDRSSALFSLSRAVKRSIECSLPACGRKKKKKKKKEEIEKSTRNGNRVTGEDSEDRQQRNIYIIIRVESAPVLFPRNNANAVKVNVIKRIYRGPSFSRGVVF